MLSSIISLSTTLFPDGSTWDPALVNASPVQATGPAILPNEPTSLALALVGIGIVVAYAGLQRWRRPQPTATNAAGAPKTSRQLSADRLKRGAA